MDSPALSVLSPSPSPPSSPTFWVGLSNPPPNIQNLLAPMLPPIAADPGSSPPTIVVDDSRNEPATKPRRSTIKRAASEISDLKSENEAPAAPAPKRRGRPPKAKPAASIPKPDQDIQEEKDEKPAAKKATTVPKKKSNNAKKDSTPTPEPTRRSARTRRATSKVAESATLTKPAGILKSKNNAASTGKKSVVFDAGVKAGSEAPSEGTLVEEEEEEEIAQLLARGPKEIRKGISKEIRRVKKGDADRAKAVANEIVAEAQMIRDAVNRNQANGGVRESEPVGPLNHLAPPFAKFWETEDNAESAAAKEVEEKKDVADGNLYFGYGVELSHSFMEARYPGIKFISLAVLEDYQFTINSSGIPTIIHCPGCEDNQSKVYGMVYALHPDHVEDIKIMKVENEIRGGEGIDEFKIDTGMVKLVGDWVANGFNAGYEPTEEQFKAKDKEIGVWMFADRQEKDATIRSEKLSHGLQNGMNKGMMEAMIQGMPKTYEGVLRSHVPFPKTPHGVFW